MRARGNGKPRDRGTGRLGEPENQDTVVQNSPKSRRKYWAIRSSIHSFACTTQLLALHCAESDQYGVGFFSTLCLFSHTVLALPHCAHSFTF